MTAPRPRARLLVALALSGAALFCAARSSAQPARPPTAPSDPYDEDEDEAGRGPRVTPRYFPVNASFLHPLATNFAEPNLWTNFDLAILLGRVGFVDGLQVGLIDWTVYDLRGVQAGVIAAVGRRASGVQVGAGFAYADHHVQGLQLAGLLGWATHDLAGADIAGVANQTYGNLDGVQAAGVLSVTRKQLTGAQLSGAVNIGRVEGLQVGGINVSQDVHGLQIGVINVARNIHGLQIGVINITDNLEGESLGIIPLPRRGGIHLVAWGSSSLYGNLGIKFASRYAYSLISGALHSVPKGLAEGSPRQAVVGGGLTFGARFALGDGFGLASDVGGYRFFRERFGFVDHDEMLKTRILVSYSLAPRLTPFVGIGAFVSFRGAETVKISNGPEFSAGMEF